MIHAELSDDQGIRVGCKRITTVRDDAAKQRPALHQSPQDPLGNNFQVPRFVAAEDRAVESQSVLDPRCFIRADFFDYVQRLSTSYEGLPEPVYYEKLSASG